MSSLTDSSSSTTTTKRLSVRALYDHEAEEEDELNFKAGDAVEVVEKLEGGWWRGSCRGKEGLFPSNYVQNPWNGCITVFKNQLYELGFNSGSYY